MPELVHPPDDTFVLTLGLSRDAGERIDVFYTATPPGLIAAVMHLLLADLRAQQPAEPAARDRWQGRFNTLSTMYDEARRLDALTHGETHA